MLDNVVTRRLAGTIGVILLVALTYLGLEYAFAPDQGSFEVEAVLGNAGVGLSSGNSVKVRGVEVGQVVSTRYEDGQAYATLRFDPATQIPREGLVMQVTAKTLLGEKQVEIAFPDSSFGEPPYLSQGDQIEQSRQPTELSEVLDTLTPFLDAIDEEDLATIIDVLGQQQGEGDTIARSLDLTAQVADFLDRTAADQLDRFRTLTSVADQLTPAAGEFDRLNRNLPGAVALIAERTDDIDTNLDLLSAFSVTLADYVQVEDDRFRQLLLTNDAVGAVIDPNIDNLASLVEGINQYSETLGKPADFMTDGTLWAGFKIFVDLSQFGLPIGTEGGINLNPIFGDNGGGVLPIDITEITDLESGPLGPLLPDGRRAGRRTTESGRAAQPEPRPEPAPPAPEAEPEPQPSSTEPQQGSLLDDGEDGR